MGLCSEIHVVARFRKYRDWITESMVFVKNKAKAASRVGCNERRVMYFSKLLFKCATNEFSFRRAKSQKTGSHPARDLL